MRRIKGIGLGLLAATLVAGCGDEGPVSTGSELLGEALRTVHVVLDAPQFLEADTTYDRIGSLNGASFGVVGNDFENEMDAHVLFQISRPVRATYVDPEGNTRTDSLEAIRGGRVTVVVDSQTAAQPPLELAVYDVTEDWDAASANWTHRVDTTGTRETWTTPGGTLGSERGAATWTGDDTVVIAIDSATASVWHDPDAAGRGGALRLSSPDNRLRLQTVEFAFDIVPAGTPDTVLQGGSVIRRITVATPDSAPGTEALRVGGLPVWRSALKFRSLSDVTVPCENGPTSCTIELSEVTVTAASLLMSTHAAGGRRPERGMRMESRGILQGPGVPLTRSPFTGVLGRMDEDIGVSAFSAPAAQQVRVPVTGYVQDNVSTPDDETPVLWLALVAVAEKTLFGYGEFGSLDAADPPQLELIVTIPVHKVQ